MLKHRLALLRGSNSDLELSRGSLTRTQAEEQEAETEHLRGILCRVNHDRAAREVVGNACREHHASRRLTEVFNQQQHRYGKTRRDDENRY